MVEGEDNKEILSLIWGEGNPTPENHSRALTCLNSECRLKNKFFDEDKRKNFTVGIKKAPYVSGNNEQLAQIVECPECFEKWWTHISNEDATKCLNEIL